MTVSHCSFCIAHKDCDEVRITGYRVAEEEAITEKLKETSHLCGECCFYRTPRCVQAHLQSDLTLFTDLACSNFYPFKARAARFNAQRNTIQVWRNAIREGKATAELWLEIHGGGKKT